MFVPKSNNTYKVYEQKNAINKNAFIGNYYISKEKFDELKGFEVFPNDIIVSCAGTIGETFILPEGIERGIINQALMRIMVYKRQIIPFYLIYFDSVLKNEANQQGKGIAIKNIPSFDVLKNFLIPLPPLSEQRRIVGKIEELLALVDDLEANKTDLQSYIKQAKSKVLEMAVRGELVPQNPNDEPASVLLERIKKEQKSSKSKGKNTAHNTHYEEEFPFDIPENWALTRMENICQLLDGEKKQGVELPYLDVKFLRGKIEGEIKESGKYIPKNTHLILVDGENSGEIFKAQQDGYQGSTLKILNISEEICKKYIFYILKKEQKLFKESKTGSAIPHLNKKLFNDLLIFLPPLAEQHRIVEKIEHIFAVLEELEENIL